ncbi:MAG TPA: serine/threonine-protein kinase [Isosphaeraceae bacterium]|nr:serine/threonine-protein kinase [Isosphaeraceae bacterium]
MRAVRTGTPQCLSRTSEHPWDFTSATTIPRRSGTPGAEEDTAGPAMGRGACPGLVAEPARPSSSRMTLPRPLAAGHRLGPYRLLERLGQGAQGEVWKALRLDRRAEFVALKVLKSALASNPARMAQFRREAERGVRLDGPSLLPVYELSTCDGHHFMAMPYVEGTSLREVIKSRLRDGGRAPRHFLTSLEEPDYLRAMTRILAKAARALGRVHDHRIAHRDIKPANLLLVHDRSEEVYLCDFGLGRDLEVATAEQMRDGAGTPMYMAPERLLRALADEIKCDIYSMGVTLFEAFTLQRPFQVPGHLTSSSLPAFLVRTEPRRPRAVCPGLPPEHEAVILKAMARNPSRRYESAYQLAADLERLDVSREAPAARAIGKRQVASGQSRPVAPKDRCLT